MQYFRLVIDFGGLKKGTVGFIIYRVQAGEQPMYTINFIVKEGKGDKLILLGRKNMQDLVCDLFEEIPLT